MIGYLDLPSGISGDMWLGCILDCGWDLDRLREVIKKLGMLFDDWSIETRQVQKGALRATQVDVKIRDPEKKNDSIEYHPDGNSHHHAYCSSQNLNVANRNLTDIFGIIDGSLLPGKIKATSKLVFERLAEAEAKVHGISVNRVHFHEVGAVDAIIDIVGTVAGIYELGIEKLYASALPLSRGWTKSQHGIIPLPAPATLEILASVSAPTIPALGYGELVTPTGAALLCQMAEFRLPFMCIKRIGTGAGKADFLWPNIARLWIGQEEQ